MQRHDNFSKFTDFRKEFPFISFDEYHYHYTGNSLEISFSFDLSGKYFFKPHISIPYKKDLFRPYDKLTAEALDNLVFHIGMIELISYWKAACPPKVIIKPHSLSARQVKFWKKIYYLGLGEFFYLNSVVVHEDEFMEMICQEGEPACSFRHISPGGSLVPVGGGKDSAVTMGLLNKTGENWLPFVINHGKTSQDVIAAAGKTRDLTVEFRREIHPQLLKLNTEGFLNGHTPFSALLAFYSLLAAYLTGRSEIILSNESSANEVTVPGTSINHQYSKSVSFEKDFRDYYREYLSPGFNYFSLLRPLSELQIAKLFSEMPGFFSRFRSCNAGSKTFSWCGKCPKCLFTFIILSPFLKPAELTAIFGRNLLDDPYLEAILEELNGEQAIKPFECIGTVDEVNAALSQAVKMYEGNDLPYLLKLHQQKTDFKGNSNEVFEQLQGKLELDHFVPAKYLNLLLKELK